ncbi:L,D-transpeptidase [Microbacterium sp. A82]|uniref:L,D-transpeptidase n=1 Tax=Microbacterium sp. A82 TaxID=3450452 RepID=UPI003F2A5AE0
MQKRTGWMIALVAALAVALVLTLLWIIGSRQTEASPPEQAATAIPTQTPTPTPSETPTGFPANTSVYDVAVLPEANVYAVNAALPVDDAPDAPTSGQHATAQGEGAPVWADPTAEPVAYLPIEFVHGGTTVPVIERQEHWVRVLLSGRQAIPSQGNPAQITGWLRVADVVITESAVSVEVSLSERTVDIVRDGVPERIATDFAWGTEATPTPIGRSFVMKTAVVPEFGYTRGHPIVYLAVQSPTLDGFAGGDVAVTAFHYHDARAGAISNGCIRLDPAAIDALAQVPVGTPVYIRP